MHYLYNKKKIYSMDTSADDDGWNEENVWSMRIKIFI